MFECTNEAFNEWIIPWMSRFNENGLTASSGNLVFDFVRNKFGTVVTSDILRHAMTHHQPVKNIDDFA